MLYVISSEIDLENILSESASKFKLLIIEFFATWCDLSLQFAPEFERLSIEFSADVNFVRIDCNKLQDLALKLKIKSLPTVKGYFNRQETFSLSGSHVTKTSLQIQENMILPLLKKLSTNMRIYLLNIIDNIVSHPSEQQYRIIKLEKLVGTEDLRECLLSLGFQSDGDQLFVEQPISIDKFTRMRNQLLLLGVKVEQIVHQNLSNCSKINQCDNNKPREIHNIKREKSVLVKFVDDLDQKSTCKSETIDTKTPNKQISNELRRKIIHSLENNICSRKSASEKFNVPYATVACIYRKYCLSEETDKKIRTRYKPKKLRDNEILTIKNWLANDCTLTLGEIKNRILNELGISVSIVTISRYISDFYFSIQRVEKVVDPSVNELDKDRLRTMYRLWLTNAMKEDRHLVFVDVTGYRVLMRGFHRKSLSGENATIKTKTRTVMVAMTKTNLFHYRSLLDPGGQFSVMDLLMEIIDIFADKQMKNVALVVDGSFCKSVELHNVIISNGHELVELPPDSPYWSPIEFVYSQVPSLVGSRCPENEEQLMNGFDSLPGLITVAQCSGYFQQCLYNAGVV